MTTVQSRVFDAICEIIVDNPPVNALGQSVRSGLVDAIEAASADDSVRAIVLRCAGRTFFAGADITEFGKPAQPPSLPDVISAIEMAKKPVIAAMHGNALGGGLEVALGCHYRIAALETQLGLPEVKLGLIPGAGGTQRLPRVVGLRRALEMIVGGLPISSNAALEIGLVDRLASAAESLGAEALAFAQDMAARPMPLPVSARDVEDAAQGAEIIDIYCSQNLRNLQNLEAPKACIRAVRAAFELAFEQGLSLERLLFTELVAGEQSRALRHVFFAERSASKIDDLPAETSPLPVARVGVIGAGTMGSGIAMNFLLAGIPVVLVEREAALLERGCETIKRNFAGSLKRGRLDTKAIENALALLSPSLRFEQLADCDLIIEAVFELMDVKKEIFSEIDKIAKPDAILATNTSYLDVDEIARAAKRPQAVVGMHFFSPANIMKLLEVVRGEKTSHEVLRTVMDMARRIDKVAVVSGVCHGFIGNRMLAKRQDQAMQLVVEGALPWEVDQVLLDFGMPMGPFQMTDLAGLDLGWTREKSTSSTLKEVLCEADRRGQKNGRGFYDYDESRKRSPSAAVVKMIEEFRAVRGIKPRPIGREEILERLLYPMINEGAWIVEEGIAQRTSDVDLVWIHGYGWPRQTGGPMFWAERLGTAAVVSGLRRWSSHLPADMKIAPSLEAAAEG